MKKQREINEDEKNCLELIEEQLTEDITNWEIIKTENLYDEDEDLVYRGFYFNRGNETHEVAISPDAIIKGCKIDIPSLLVVDISNSLIYLLNNIITSLK